MIIADPGEGIVKLTPEEFFGEIHEEGKPPKYQWSGVLILLVRNETFKKGGETKGLFGRFFSFAIAKKEIISRFNDAGKVRDAISGATLTIMIDSLMALAGAIILYMQNAKLFGITVIIVVLYAIIVACFHKWYEKLNRKQMEDNAQLTSYMVESLNGIQTVKAYSAERKVNRETEIKFVKLLRSIFDLT